MAGVPSIKFQNLQYLDIEEAGMKTATCTGRWPYSLPARFHLIRRLRNMGYG